MSWSTCHLWVLVKIFNKIRMQMWFPDLTMLFRCSCGCIYPPTSHIFPLPPLFPRSLPPLTHSQIFNNLLLKVYKQPSRTVLYKHYDLYLADAPFFKIIKAISFCHIFLLCCFFFFAVIQKNTSAHHIGVRNGCVSMCLYHEHTYTQKERERRREGGRETAEALIFTWSL